jgi:hypothetical protein
VGGEGPARLVEIVDVRRRDRRRGQAPRIGKGHLVENQHARLGLEHLGHLEAEERVAPRQHGLFAVAQHDGQNRLSRVGLRKLDPRVAGCGRLRQRAQPDEQ